MTKTGPDLGGYGVAGPGNDGRDEIMEAQDNSGPAGDQTRRAADDPISPEARPMSISTPDDTPPPLTWANLRGYYPEITSGACIPCFLAYNRGEFLLHDACRAALAGDA